MYLSLSTEPAKVGLRVITNLSVKALDFGAHGGALFIRSESTSGPNEK